MNKELEANTSLSHYRLLSKIGAGGMGEVYLAEDTKLDRKVALKILPADVAVNPDRMKRFVQEAKAASSLNHPNILTVYEIGHADSVHFIATEFIEGETLRQHLRSEHMRLSDTLNVATQVADALAVAHEVGIIHRDIKPENIMLRKRDKYVKVLDFGLAKLIEQPPVPINREAPTKSLFKTEEGVVMGTVTYMSPEQATGLKVDARTDIWSLGVVLYEMVAGCLPFEGSTMSELLASILSQKEPPPLARFAREVPAELERIVEKVLRKDREERYQTAKDMLLDLRRLKQKLDVDAEIERTVPPESRSAPNEAIPFAGREADSTAQASSAQTATLESAHATSSTEYIISEIKRHKRGVAALLAAITLLSVASVAYYFYTARGSSRDAIDSIAVMPLVNTTGDPNTEYLSDGISEALINSLSELQQLRVIARSTAFRYKGKEVEPQAVGRELNVRAVLMGRVRQIGEKLNIQVDLVDATTGAQLWGEEYERKVSDILSVKQSIAREVTEKLRLRLSGEDHRRLVRRDTTNAEVYQFYLRGRFFWNKRTADGIRKAMEQFQQAIDRDPNFALGHVGLADCYLTLEEYAGVPASETVPKARAAADRALQIDDSLAEAHASSAVTYKKLWRWAEAEEGYKRSISLNPNYPTVHHWFAIYFYTKGQFDEAMKEIKRAQELDPLSPVISNNVAIVYLLKNDPSSAIEQSKRIIELDPGYPGGREQMGWAYFKQGRHEEATAEFERAVELSGRASLYLSSLGYCYAVNGRRAEALAILKELEERYAGRKAIAKDLAGVYAGLGDKDQAFGWLEKGFEQRSGELPYITTQFNFENLRSDPRYAELVRRMGLQP
jgi:eukaryotic-like serine/threonine-protein kinase